MGVMQACSNNAIPDDVLKPAAMKEVMFDLLLTETLEAQDSIAHPASEKEAIRKQVFKTHGITPTSFQKSLAFYQANPALYKQLADSLAAFSTRQAADIQRVDIKPLIHGRNLEDSSGSLRDFKKGR